MKKDIIICNTYFQLIEAIQLKNTLFLHESVTVVFSDHSRNAENIIKQIKSLDVFEQCFFWSSFKKMKEQEKNSHENRRLLLCEINGKNGYGNPFESGICDELIYYNQFDNLKVVFAELYEKNPQIKVSRFEEGIFSYADGEYLAKKDKIVNPLRKILGKKTLLECQQNFYCFYPELYEGHLNPVQIPRIEADGKTAQVLSKLFDTSTAVYPQKYIFFSSVFDFEGGAPVGELEVIKKAAALVGSENLIVKVHPRDSIDRFVSAGLNVDKNSAIPWEAIQLGRDFSDHVFLTVNSGSVLSVSMLQEKKPKIHFLYKLCDLSGNPSAAANTKKINEVLSEARLKDKLSDVDAPETLDAILD